MQAQSIRRNPDAFYNGNFMGHIFFYYNLNRDDNGLKLMQKDDRIQELTYGE